MNKKPSLYFDEIKLNKKHNKQACYIVNQDIIQKQLNDIYNGNEPIYMIRVLIKTKNNTIETRIIEIRKKELITINKKKLLIDDIINIKRIS